MAYSSALEDSFIISFSFPSFDTFINSLSVRASWMLAGVKEIYYWGGFFNFFVFRFLNRYENMMQEKT